MQCNNGEFMATFYLKLSKRIQKETQMGELIIRLRNGNDYDILVKSGLFITPDNFKMVSLWLIVVKLVMT